MATFLWGPTIKVMSSSVHGLLKCPIQFVKQNIYCACDKPKGDPAKDEQSVFHLITFYAAPFNQLKANILKPHCTSTLLLQDDMMSVTT